MPDQLLPQPPDGNKSAKRWPKTGFFITMLVMVGAFLALRPWVAAQYIKAQQTHAIGNLRQIGLSLSEFQSEYGSYPDTATAAEVKRRTHSALNLSADTSNDVFTQLIAAGFAEERFFNAHSQFTKKPDNVSNSNETAMAPGECGFAYVSGLSDKDNPSSPMVFGAVIPGTSKIDSLSYAGKAVGLNLANSVASLPITPAGKIIYHGLNLLDPRQPFWHGKAPDVKWPK